MNWFTNLFNRKEKKPDINPRQTSDKELMRAEATLHDPKASKVAKTLAGSLVAQYHTEKETSADVETLASDTLRNPKSSALEKSLAGSVMGQADKARHSDRK